MENEKYENRGMLTKPNKKHSNFKFNNLFRFSHYIIKWNRPSITVSTTYPNLGDKKENQM